MRVRVRVRLFQTTHRAMLQLRSEYPDRRRKQKREYVLEFLVNSELGVRARTYIGEHALCIYSMAWSLALSDHC